MVILRKISGATLVEALLASVIVLVVFFMASIILNSSFKSSLQSTTMNIDNRVRELLYQFENGNLETPYYEETVIWSLSLYQDTSRYILEVEHKGSGTVEKIFIADEK